MKRPFRGLIVGLVISGATLVTVTGTLSARQNKSSTTPAVAPANPPASGSKQATLSGENLQHDDQTGIGTARNFRYNEPDAKLTVTGLFVKHDKKNKKMWPEGNLVLDDDKHHVTGEKADVDYNKSKKLAIITGNVVIVLKNEEETAAASTPAPAATKVGGGIPVAQVTPPPPPAEKDDVGKERKRGVTITCDRVEDYYGKKFIIMRGNLVFKQKIIKKDGKMVERTLNAEHAEYDGKAEKLVLFKPVKGTDTDNQKVSFEGNVIVGTKEGAENMESKEKFNGTINLDEDNEDETSASKSPKK